MIHSPDIIIDMILSYATQNIDIIPDTIKAIDNKSYDFGLCSSGPVYYFGKEMALMYTLINKITDKKSITLILENTEKNPKDHIQVYSNELGPINGKIYNKGVKKTNKLSKSQYKQVLRHLYFLSTLNNFSNINIIFISSASTIGEIHKTISSYLASSFIMFISNLHSIPLSLNEAEILHTEYINKTQDCSFSKKKENIILYSFNKTLKKHHKIPLILGYGNSYIYTDDKNNVTGTLSAIG